MKEHTVLDILSDERVVSFHLSEDRKTVGVEECCDGYFTYQLSKEQTMSLIKELQDIYEKMA